VRPPRVASTRGNGWEGARALPMETTEPGRPCFEEMLQDNRAVI